MNFRELCPFDLGKSCRSHGFQADEAVTKQAGGSEHYGEIEISSMFFFGSPSNIFCDLGGFWKLLSNLIFWWWASRGSVAMLIKVGVAVQNFGRSRSG